MNSTAKQPTRRLRRRYATLVALLVAVTVHAAHAARAPMKRPAAPAAATMPSLRPVDVAVRAKTFEEQGNYASALQELKRLRAMQGPDADVELAIALDEARTGLADSAWARLHGPLLSAALADTNGVVRRTDYPFQREHVWVNGSFDGWYWYIARARAELALARGEWAEAVRMASVSAEARPLSGKDMLLLALAASRAGDAAYGEAAANYAAYLEPWLPEAWHLAGIWAWRNGRRAEARERFATAAAIDSSWREPVLAMARLQLPGARADSLPARFLYGARACAILTSAKRPKREEFVQYDATPMLAFNPMSQPEDSLRARMRLRKPLQVFVQVLVGENGRPIMVELPYLTEDRFPAGVVHHVLRQIGDWRFVPARKFDKPQRSWASVEYVLQP
jgi:hypothetical protein